MRAVEGDVLRRRRSGEDVWSRATLALAGAMWSRMAWFSQVGWTVPERLIGGVLARARRRARVAVDPIGGPRRPLSRLQGPGRIARETDLPGGSTTDFASGGCGRATNYPIVLVHGERAVGFERDRPHAAIRRDERASAAR